MLFKKEKKWWEGQKQAGSLIQGELIMRLKKGYPLKINMEIAITSTKLKSKGLILSWIITSTKEDIAYIKVEY